MAPSRGLRLINWRELWRHREVLYFLAWRDIKVRYKQTLMGIAWAALQPLVPMVVFTILFGRFAGLERRTGDIPYFLFVFTGLLPCNFFASAVTTGGVSLVANSNLVSKVYFPRLVVPFAAVLVAAIDSIVSAVLLLALLVRSGVTPAGRVFLAPVFFVATVLLAAGVAALLDPLGLRRPDDRLRADLRVTNTAAGGGLGCRLFADGFESGGTLAWSVRVP